MGEGSRERGRGRKVARMLYSWKRKGREGGKGGKRTKKKLSKGSKNAHHHHHRPEPKFSILIH